jgi:hypothetical protein
MQMSRSGERAIEGFPPHVVRQVRCMAQIPCLESGLCLTVGHTRTRSQFDRTDRDRRMLSELPSASWQLDETIYILLVF